MKLETSPKVTKSKQSLHWCRSISEKISVQVLLQYQSKSYYIINDTYTVCMNGLNLSRVFVTKFLGVHMDPKAVFTLVILPDARTVRERYASGCPCTHCVHCVGFVRYTQTTSGGVLSGRERYASGWRCSVNARVDASGTAATRRLRMYAD